MSNHSMTNQTRKNFEAWAKIKNYELLKSGGGSYLYIQANIAWKAWQAATLAERERCARVCEKRSMGVREPEDVEALDCAAEIRQGGDV